MEAAEGEMVAGGSRDGKYCASGRYLKVLF